MKEKHQGWVSSAQILPNDSSENPHASLHCEKRNANQDVQSSEKQVDS